MMYMVTYTAKNGMRMSEYYKDINIARAQYRAYCMPEIFKTAATAPHLDMVVENGDIVRIDRNSAHFNS